MVLSVFCLVLSFVYQVYANGIHTGGPQFDTGTWDMVTHDDTSREIGFGRKYPNADTSDGNYATYALDDLLVWNGYILTDAEILQLYNSY